MMTGSTYLAETWLDPRLELRRSLIHGRGLFATAPIAAPNWSLGVSRAAPRTRTSQKIC
jgi:hypothetical protein